MAIRAPDGANKERFKCFQKHCNQKLLNGEKLIQNRALLAKHFGQWHGKFMNTDKEHSTG